MVHQSAPSRFDPRCACAFRAKSSVVCRLLRVPSASRACRAVGPPCPARGASAARSACTVVGAPVGYESGRVPTPGGRERSRGRSPLAPLSDGGTAAARPKFTCEIEKMLVEFSCHENMIVDQTLTRFHRGTLLTPRSAVPVWLVQDARESDLHAHARSLQEKGERLARRAEAS